MNKKQIKSLSKNEFLKRQFSKEQKREKIAAHMNFLGLHYIEREIGKIQQISTN
jgi:hypothetical protein